MANDWQDRLASLHKEAVSTDENLGREARRGIRRLLLGVEAESIDMTLYKDLAEEIDAQLMKLFNPALSKLVSKQWIVSCFSAPYYSQWKAVQVQLNQIFFVDQNATFASV